MAAWEASGARAALTGSLAAIFVALLSASAFAADDATLVAVFRMPPDAGDRYRVAPAVERKEVTVMRGAQRLAAADGLPLKPDDSIQTSERTSALVRYPAGHEVLVMPNTKVQIEPTRVFATFGELFVRAFGAFRVETSFLSAGVEGTEFVLRERPGAPTQVIVAEGAVLCRSPTDSWRPVRVAAAEQIQVHPPAVPQHDLSVPGRTRSASSDRVQKLQAQGYELARLGDISRALTDFKRAPN